MEKGAQGSDETQPRMPRSTTKMGAKRSRSSRPSRQKSRGESSAPSKNDKKVEIGAAEYLAVKGAKKLRDIISHPEYAHDDDGLGN